MDTATPAPGTAVTPRARVKATFSTLRQTRFLDAFASLGSVQSASRWADITRDAHYKWLRDDPSYPARFDEALKAAARRFEDEAVRRAVEGMPKGIYYKGKRVAIEREYSDQLLALLLKANNPEKFGDKSKLDVNVARVTSIEQVPTEVLLQLLPEAERAEFERKPNWLLDGPTPIDVGVKTETSPGLADTPPLQPKEGQ